MLFLTHYDLAAVSALITGETSVGGEPPTDTLPPLLGGEWELWPDETPPELQTAPPPSPDPTTHHPNTLSGSCMAGTYSTPRTVTLVE